MIFLQKLRNKSPGQSLTELAISLPLLFMILLGVVDLGRLYYSYITITNAAREGARYGAANPSAATTAIQDRAINESSGSGVTLTRSNVTVSCPSGCVANQTLGQSNPIQVTVTFSFQMMTTYVLGTGPIPMRAVEQMDIFGQ